MDDIIAVLAKIPAETKALYPAHILQPVRIEIARQLVLKEYYKLFPHFTLKQYAQMNTDILGWLAGEGHELAPVHDFWNFMDGTMQNLKLKDIVPQITSAHIIWQQGSVDPRDITLGAPIGNLAEHGNPPYSYDFIKQHILDNPEQRQINQKISDTKAGDTVMPRDFPIVVRRNLDGSLRLLDGNRRTMRALLQNKSALDAWIGTVTTEPALHDHWVSTGTLRRLLSQYVFDKRPEVAQSIRSQLAILFASSTIARINFEQRCLDHPSLTFAKEIAQGL